MGMDLTLYPLYGPQELGNTSAYWQDYLRFQRDNYDIFSQLTKFEGYDDPTIRPQPIPPQLSLEFYDDEGHHRTREDRWGAELTFAWAKQLKQLRLGENPVPKNKAIKAFIDELPDEIPIILYWH